MIPDSGRAEDTRVARRRLAGAPLRKYGPLLWREDGRPGDRCETYKGLRCLTRAVPIPSLIVRNA